MYLLKVEVEGGVHKRNQRVYKRAPTMRKLLTLIQCWDIEMTVFPFFEPEISLFSLQKL